MTTAKRLPQVPDAPAISETVPGFAFNAWCAFMVPAKTPPEIVAKLNAAAHAALNDPAVQKRLVELGFVAAPNSPEQLAAHLLRAEYTRTGNLVRNANSQELAFFAIPALMKIVIPDDYQDMVDQLTCFSLIRHHDVTRYREPARDLDQLVERLRDADVVVSIRERVEFSRELMERLPKLNCSRWSAATRTCSTLPPAPSSASRSRPASAIRRTRRPS